MKVSWHFRHEEDQSIWLKCRQGFLTLLLQAGNTRTFDFIPLLFLALYASWFPGYWNHMHGMYKCMLAVKIWALCVKPKWDTAVLFTEARPRTISTLSLPFWGCVMWVWLTDGIPRWNGIFCEAKCSYSHVHTQLEELYAVIFLDFFVNLFCCFIRKSQGHHVTSRQKME